MIKDRKYRQKLIARYLEADTTVQEEIMLAEYYRTHKAEADEADVATLILMDYPVADILSDPERKRDIRFISMAIRHCSLHSPDGYVHHTTQRR